MRALTIPGLTSDADVHWLADQARTRETIIELGPFRGRSTRALADASSGIVYAIDNWNATHGLCRRDDAAAAACRENLRDLIEAGRVVLVEQDSRAGLPSLLAGVRADMLWIDAEHTYEAVRSDIETYGPLVRRGGLICGHDYNVHHAGVMRAVDEAYGARVRTVAPQQSIWWVAA